MAMLKIPLGMTCFVILQICCWAQSSNGGSPDSSQKVNRDAPAQPVAEKTREKLIDNLHLTPLEAVTSSEVANSFLGPFVCDGDANLYLRSENAGVTGIRKLNAKGERVTLFEPSANPDIKVGLTGYFTLSKTGELYALIFPADQIYRFVMVFASDGTYKTSIKLDPGFVWFPSALAVFPNGNFLITGERYDRDPKLPRLPFTGIFRSDGRLLKELDLEDDNLIHEMGKAHDTQVTLPQHPTGNRAVALSQMEPAVDGNLYLMRWLSPAVFYAISPSGEVVRRFTVDPTDSKYRPFAMHISGNRIATLFYEPQTMEKVLKIVDLEGNELASYDELRENGKPAHGMLGLAFACYSAQPERFTFLITNDKHQILLKHAAAK